MPDLLHGHGVVSGLTVLIRGRAQPIGMLGVFTAQQRNFTADHAYLLQGVAELLSTAIERKRAEQQAVTLEAERQRVALLREFIRDVSHDFRTPLSIIGTSAYLVRKTTDATKLQQYSERIEEQISRLGTLMDNFVELVNMEQEGTAVQFQPTDLNALVMTILERSQPATVSKHQHVSYQAETDATLVLGDPLALTKAITNVVANAIHYTPEAGTITIHLYRQRESAVLEVADSGMGIAAEDLPHIFDSIYRADSARSMELGGAGVGLTIAKTIVELMQGHIEVQSELGHGSVFRLYLRQPSPKTVAQEKRSFPVN